MTARTLLDALDAAGCRPHADGSDLVLAADPPARLTVFLKVLHTGVRAALTNRTWYGLPEGGRAIALDPRDPIPAGARFLSVAGDTKWDRVLGAARLDSPHLFASPAAHGPIPRPRVPR